MFHINFPQDHKKSFKMFGYKLFMYPAWIETLLSVLCFLIIWYFIIWGALNFDMNKHAHHNRISKEQTCLNQINQIDVSLIDVAVIKNKCYILIK